MKACYYSVAAAFITLTFTLLWRRWDSASLHVQSWNTPPQVRWLRCGGQSVKRCGRCVRPTPCPCRSTGTMTSTTSGGTSGAGYQASTRPETDTRPASSASPAPVGKLFNEALKSCKVPDKGTGKMTSHHHIIQMLMLLCQNLFIFILTLRFVWCRWQRSDRLVVRWKAAWCGR